MLTTTKGIIIMRQNGHRLIEYSCGDHPESIYYIKHDGETEDIFYAVPSKGHRFAISRFHEFIEEQSR